MTGGEAQAPIRKFQVRGTPNPRWSTHFNNKLFTIRSEPLFTPNETVYTIGSCFAERIRLALEARNVKVGPPMQDIQLDDASFRIDSLPRRPHMNYYNSFTIRQEFERHIGEWAQDPDDYWAFNRDRIWGGDVVYQDPYRRAVFARTPEALRTAVKRIDAAIDRGIREADVFFITLGMAEVFRNRRSGKIACQKPGYAGGAGEDETEYHMSSFQENYDNMARVVEIIRSIHPGARIVATVSPVSLARTFSDNDILVANCEGKSLLRAVLGQLARDFPAVTYFPSYEIVMSNAPMSFREDDGRHVADWIVSKIVSSFCGAHLTQETPAPA